MHHFTFWTLIISRINKDSDWQPNSDLAQSVEHWHNGQEVLDSIPLGANILTEFILLFPMLTFVDNAVNFLDP